MTDINTPSPTSFWPLVLSPPSVTLSGYCKSTSEANTTPTCIPHPISPYRYIDISTYRHTHTQSIIQQTTNWRTQLHSTTATYTPLFLHIPRVVGHSPTTGFTISKLPSIIHQSPAGIPRTCKSMKETCQRFPHRSFTLPVMIPDDNLSGISRRPPKICVDYLSHEWDEYDIWTSWKAMSKQKKEITNGIRLENASWRTWAKQKYNLRTVNPSKLNWLKDSDVTWLYGPLHTAHSPILVETSPKSPTTEDKLNLIGSIYQKSCLKKKIDIGNISI